MTRRRIVIKTRDAVALRENFNSAARREEGAASPPTQKKTDLNADRSVSAIDEGDREAGDPSAAPYAPLRRNAAAGGHSSSPRA